MPGTLASCAGPRSPPWPSCPPAAVLPPSTTGTVAYAPTPLTGHGQIVDLPQPLQALQLCTLAQQEVTATRLTATDQGRCELQTTGPPISVALRLGDHPPTDYPDRIAGRPAHTLPGGVLVRLRDDAQVDLVVDASDPAALAEQLVPLLLA